MLAKLRYQVLILFVAILGLLLGAMYLLADHSLIGGIYGSAYCLSGLGAAVVVAFARRKYFVQARVVLAFVNAEMAIAQVIVTVLQALDDLHALRWRETVFARCLRHPTPPYSDSVHSGVVQRLSIHPIPAERTG